MTSLVSFGFLCSSKSLDTRNVRIYSKQNNMGAAPSVALAKVHIRDQQFTVLELALFLFEKFVADQKPTGSIRNALTSRCFFHKCPLTASGECGRIQSYTTHIHTRKGHLQCPGVVGYSNVWRSPGKCQRIQHLSLFRKVRK